MRATLRRTTNYIKPANKMEIKSKLSNKIQKKLKKIS